MRLSYRPSPVGEDSNMILRGSRGLLIGNSIQICFVVHELEWKALFCTKAIFVLFMRGKGMLCIITLFWFGPLRTFVPVKEGLQNITNYKKTELEVMENNNCCSLRLLCTHESIRRLSTRLSFRYISSRLPTRAMGHVPFQPPVLCHQVEPVEQFWPSHSFQYGPSLTVLWFAVIPRFYNTSASTLFLQRNEGFQEFDYPATR